ncbi:MAG: spermidine/putrescine ABC transporter permease [Blastocatellia bacterium AA13]|nr:MAG: spermidine/putrescine ABC transporter permease [Blastocatellia bacterium AA13]
MKIEKKENRIFSFESWISAAPLTLFLVCFFYVPAGLLLVASFLKKGEGDSILLVFTVEHYVRLVSDAFYVSAIVKSLVVSAVVALLCGGLAFPLCYMLAFRWSRSASRQVLILLMVPFWTSYLVRTFAWMSILGDKGLLNELLIWLGVIKNPLPLLYSWLSVILSMVGFYLPFMIVAIYASLLRIDRTLLMAARDLGATSWGVIRKVLLPLAAPGFFAGFVFVFVPSLDEFVSPQVLGGSNNFLIANFISTFFKNSFEYSFGSALAFASLTFGLCVLLVVRRVAGVSKHHD